MIPSDIVVEDNLLTKDPSWQGTSWSVKNLFELKNARRVTVRRNIMQYNWSGAQPGYAVVFTPRNSSGLNPWAVITDVEFSGNVVAHSGSAFNVLGHDDTAPSGQLARVVIKNNLVFDITTEPWGSAGVFVQIGNEPRDVAIDHNTVLHDGNIVSFYGGAYINGAGAAVSGGSIAGFVFTNNLVRHNTYGMAGDGQSYGNGSIAYYAPGAVIQPQCYRERRPGGVAIPSGQFLPVARRLYGNISQQCRRGLSPGGNQSVPPRRTRRKRSRLRFRYPSNRTVPSAADADAVQNRSVGHSLTGYQQIPW